MNSLENSDAISAFHRQHPLLTNWRGIARARNYRAESYDTSQSLIVFLYVKKSQSAPEENL
jgi:hypothetical protein